MLKHSIGLDYTSIIQSRKKKRDLPLVGKLNFTFDVEKLTEELSKFIEFNSLISYNETGKDKASNENNYNLKNKNKNLFINNYKEIYKLYAVVGFQSLSDEAVLLAETTDIKMEDLSPYDRARGMRLTASRYYHPHYDERNYTKPTEYYKGYFKTVLESFSDEVCRSGTVCLHPDKFLSPHFDIGPEYVVRLHIPIITNELSILGLRSKTDKNLWEIYHLPADGSIYFINSGYEHFAINEGVNSRYHIRVCLNGQQSIEDLVCIKPDYVMTDIELQNKPYSGKYQDTKNNYTGVSLKEIDLDKNYNKFSDINIAYKG